MLLLLAAVANPSPFRKKGRKKMYEYRVEIDRVVDGDTVDVNIDLGFGTWLRKERIRLYGIDTPESRTRDLVEKKYGLMAKDFLVEMLSHDGGIILRTKKDDKGKYGRILGELWRAVDIQGLEPSGGRKSINQMLVDEHHAVEYHGQSKDDISARHLKNRYYLLG